MCGGDKSGGSGDKQKNSWHGVRYLRTRISMRKQRQELREHNYQIKEESVRFLQTGKVYRRQEEMDSKLSWELGDVVPKFKHGETPGSK